MDSHQGEQVGPAPQGAGDAPRLLSRREVVGGGLMFGLFALTGCGGNSTHSALPNPRWHVGGEAGPVCIVPPTPAPTPPPAAAGVQILPRSAWTSAGPRKSVINPMNGIARITVHHDGMNAFTSTNQGNAASRLEQVRQSHLQRTARSGERWGDIGYHYIIDPAGRVWEGRSAQYQGAHVQDQNEHNLGVMVMGNYNRQSLNPAQMAALDGLLAMQMSRYGVPIARVRTHKELSSTECPGNSLQRYMNQTRSRGGILLARASQMRLA
jgi:hypothetical protein